MTKKLLIPDTKGFGKIMEPIRGHFTQFYKSEAELLRPLSRYIEDGIQAGETCIVIATDVHLQQLDEQLESRGVDLGAAKVNGQYVALDAAETMSKFMVGGMPDRTRFFEEIGTLVDGIIKKNSPIRAYGEMVALLWKQGNKKAVMSLEKLWDECIGAHSIALYCAYPELHFVMDSEALSEITLCHKTVLPDFAG